MKLVAAVGWEIRDRGQRTRGVDERVLPLLRAIDRTGTLAGAVRSCGIPYRTAWGLLEAAGRDIGAPLLTLSRGRGAVLTALGQRWRALDDQARQALEAAEVGVVVRRPPGPASADGAPRLRIAASHDIALAKLRENWRRVHSVALEFHGSTEALDSYRAGRVDVAGFHVTRHRAPADRSLREAQETPVDRVERSLGTARGDPLLARLDPARDALLSFITREQGLIVPRGNPHRVRSLSDAAAKGLSMVNRQPGSGTRLLLDRLLADEGVEPARLAGYSNEEFTHAAVAATVASGNADVALGIRAAAAQFRLGFVPLATERYLFACRRRALASPRIAAFRALLASESTRAVVAPLPGYALDAPGEPMSANELLA